MVFRNLQPTERPKGFTVVQIVAGLVPSNEEQAPVDPGFHNEGGAVWDPDVQSTSTRNISISPIEEFSCW